MSNNPLSFVSSYILDQDQILVTAQIDELVEAGETDSYILKWKRSEYKWKEVCDLEWSATCLCVHSDQTDQVFSTGPLGRVVIHDGNGSREEDIDNSSQGTSLHGDIRDLQFIGNHLYTTGMGRQVYRREGDDNWVRRDIDVLQTPSTTKVTGFNSIDGLNEDDIYAVGFYGEIWRYHNESWSQLESPTNVILNKIKVIRDDLVYACGQKGVLLVGNANGWGVSENDLIKDQIWDMEWFQDTLYLTTDTAIYRFFPDYTFELVDINLGCKITCGSLHAKNGLMVATGRKHIVWTEDGLIWHDITPGKEE